MWSFYVGRPESLDQHHITVSLPVSSDVTTAGNQTWKPYGDGSDHLSHRGLPCVYGEIARETVKLCSRISAIRKVLYATTSQDLMHY